MTPLEKCTQTLSTLVRLDDRRGLDLMEAAIGDLLKAAGSDREARIAALDVLANEVRRQGWGTMFAGHILSTLPNSGTASPVSRG
jgi:hypothetical protein